MIWFLHIYTNIVTKLLNNYNSGWQKNIETININSYKDCAIGSAASPVQYLLFLYVSNILIKWIVLLLLISPKYFLIKSISLSHLFSLFCESVAYFWKIRLAWLFSCCLQQHKYFVYLVLSNIFIYYVIISIMIDKLFNKNVWWFIPLKRELETTYMFYKNNYGHIVYVTYI